jgi:hypothetical protein
MDATFTRLSEQAIRIARRQGLTQGATRRYSYTLTDLGTIYATSFDSLDPVQLNTAERVYQLPALVTNLTAPNGERIQAIIDRTARDRRTLLIHTLGSMLEFVTAHGRQKMRELLTALAQQRPDLEIISILPQPYPEFAAPLPPTITVMHEYIDIPALVGAAHTHGVRGVVGVSHGGIGTTLLFKHLGIPQLVTPVLSEQHFNGQTVHTPAQPVPTIAFKRLTTSNFLAAIDALCARSAADRNAWGTPAHIERVHAFTQLSAARIAQTMLDLTHARLGRR